MHGRGVQVCRCAVLVRWPTDDVFTKMNVMNNRTARCRLCYQCDRNVRVADSCVQCVLKVDTIDNYKHLRS